MLNKISNNKLVLIGFAVIAFIWIGIRMYFGEIDEPQNTRYSLLGFLNFSPSILQIIASNIIIIACLLVMMRINREYRFVERDGNNALLFFIVGLIIFPDFQVSFPILSASFMALLSLQLLLQIHHQKVVLAQLFVSSLLACIASLFFYPFLLLLIPIFLTISLFRPFELRNYLMVLVGFFLPVFYSFSIAYLLDENIDWTILGSIEPAFIMPQWEELPYLVFLVFALISGLRILLDRSKFVVRQRNQLSIIFSFTVVLLLISVLISVEQLITPILAVMSLFCAYYYGIARRKWVIDSFLISLIVVYFLLK